MVEVSNGDIFAEMANRLKQVNGKEVDVGYFAGESSEPNGTDTAAVAIFQEFGTSRGIPSRPFLQQTLYQNSSKWSVTAGLFALRLLKGGSADGMLNQIGKQAQMDVQQTIVTGAFTPLSPETIRRKGSAKTLVESGTMLGATNFKVR